MVAFKDIERFTDRLVEAYRPHRVVLFGSYARGRARPDSDVDILVVMPFKGNGVRKAAEIVKRLRPRFALDLVVRTPKQIERRLAWHDSFLEEATTGKVIYETTDP